MELEKKMEELKNAMEREYEANNESALYLELYRKYCELDAAYDAANEKYFDEYNHRRKRCIYCGGFEFGEGACPSRQYGATGPCPSKPASIPQKN